MAYTPSLNGGRINATIGGNTAGVGTLVSTGTMTLVGGNNITLSQNANAITISAGSQSIQTMGMYAAGNTTQNSSTTVDARSVSLNGLGGLSVGYSGGSVQISAPVVSNISATGIINISSNGATVSIGAPAFSMGMSTNGNTTGTSGTVSNQIILAGGNNVTLSQSTGAGGNTISIAAGGATFSGGMSNIGNTTGTSGTVSNQLILAGGNNVTLSQSTGAGGNTISIAAGGGGLALANSQTVYSSGTASLNVAGGAMTIASSTNGASQSFNFSVPQTSSLSATGGLSISTTGSTISIGVPSLTTISRWEQPEAVFAALGALPQGSLSIQHMYIPFNVTASAGKIGGSITVGTSTAASTGSAKMSLWMGVYTLAGSTLGLATSGSANNAFSWQAASSVSSTSLTGVTGMRQLTAPLLLNITPGEYWIAAVVSSATTVGASMTLYGNNQINGAAGGAVLTPINTNTSAARDVVLFQGVYTAATAAGPSTISGGQINNTAASIVQSAGFYNAIYNATY